MDIAIINGTVVDGTGAPGVRADVGIADDRIVAVGQLALNPEKVMQGVTTNIIGNCALSPAPVNDTVRMFFENLLQHVLGTVKIRWDDFAELLHVYETDGVAPNLKSLAGQGTIRMAVMGMENRPADSREMREMQRHLSAAMEAWPIAVVRRCGRMMSPATK